MQEDDKVHQAVWNKVVVRLKNGVTTPEAIKESFKDSREYDLMYRLSVYLHHIKTVGGVIRTVKNGRAIVSYELLNPELFDDYGKLIKESESE